MRIITVHQCGKVTGIMQWIKRHEQVRFLLSRRLGCDSNVAPTCLDSYQNSTMLSDADFHGFTNVINGFR